MSWTSKDPNAVLDFQFDWSAWLSSGETITASIYLFESATLELFDESIDGGFTTFWARGGAAGEVVQITNRITSSEGRIDDWTRPLRLKER